MTAGSQFVKKFLTLSLLSYRTLSGKITNLQNELLAEILYAWEQSSGLAAG